MGNNNELSNKGNEEPTHPIHIRTEDNKITKNSTSGVIFNSSDSFAEVETSGHKNPEEEHLNRLNRLKKLMDQHINKPSNSGIKPQLLAAQKEINELSNYIMHFKKPKNSSKRRHHKELSNSTAAISKRRRNQMLLTKYIESKRKKCSVALAGEEEVDNAAINVIIGNATLEQHAENEINTSKTYAAQTTSTTSPTWKQLHEIINTMPPKGSSHTEYPKNPKINNSIKPREKKHKDDHEFKKIIGPAPLLPAQSKATLRPNTTRSDTWNGVDTPKQLHPPARQNTWPMPTEHNYSSEPKVWPRSKQDISFLKQLDKHAKMHKE